MNPFIIYFVFLCLLAASMHFFGSIGLVITAIITLLFFKIVNPFNW